MQWPEGLIVPDKELELDKQNDQALDSLIDFIFLFTQTYLLTYLLHVTSTRDLNRLDFYLQDNYLSVDLT